MTCDQCGLPLSPFGICHHCLKAAARDYRRGKPGLLKAVKVAAEVRRLSDAGLAEGLLWIGDHLGETTDDQVRGHALLAEAAARLRPPSVAGDGAAVDMEEVFLRR